MSEHTDHGSLLQSAADKVLAVDPYHKRLTGRTPERIVEETGLARETLFPVDADILYVGDPWQRMGLDLDESHGSHLTIIDYEYGETASFETNNEAFRARIREAGDTCYQVAARLLQNPNQDLSEPDKQWLDSYLALLRIALMRSDRAVSEQDYQLAASLWSQIRLSIEERGRCFPKDAAQQKTDQATGDDTDEVKITQDPFAFILRDAWYTAVDGERGFRDIIDYRTLIAPRVEAMQKQIQRAHEADGRVDMHGMMKEIESWKKTWIDGIRLKKKPLKANVVQAVFPQLPFRDGSFDRFIASWSISTHVLPDLDRSELSAYWAEIFRVLRPGGAAYIFPLNYNIEPDEVFFSSLDDCCKTSNNYSWHIVDADGYTLDCRHELQIEGTEHTLVLEKTSEAAETSAQ